MTKALNWLQVNIAVLVAFATLITTGCLWYANYCILGHQMQINTIAIKELSVTVSAHALNIDAHTNPTIQQDILHRLQRIEDLLMQSPIIRDNKTLSPPKVAK